MKKGLAVILAAIMLFSFVACKNEKSEEETTTAVEEKDPVKVDENLLTVEVTLAGSFFEGETPEEIKADAKENGMKKCVINEDGSVTYTMTRAKRNKMLDEMKANFEKTYDGFLNGEEKIPSFLDIKHNDNFSQIDIYVDKSKYTMWDSMNAMTFYLLGVYYQCFSGADFKEVDVVVNFIDNETEEILDTASYKKFAENAAAYDESDS